MAESTLSDLALRRDQQRVGSLSKVHELIRCRRSSVSFSHSDVDESTIQSVLEDIRWAPSSFNEQPWQLILAKRNSGTELFDKMLGCLSPHNRVWAKEAPLLLLAMARRHFGNTGQPNRHASHDVGLAMANLTFQATFAGLHVHQMGGFDVEKAKIAFRIPDDYEALTISAIGYGNETETASAAGECVGRCRKSVSEILFGDSDTVSLVDPA